MADKNCLTVSDAEHVERAFQEQLVSITNQAAAPSIPNAERPLRRRGRKDRRRRSAIDKSVLALPAPRRIRDREHVMHDYRQHRELLLSSLDVIHAAFRRPGSSNAAAISHSAANKMETVPSSGKNAPAVEFARCFLRLANLPNFALDRLSRYEAGCCMRSKNWTAANRRSGRVVFGSERGSENSTKSQRDEWLRSFQAMNSWVT